MFYINKEFELGIGQVWYKKVNIIDQDLLLNYLRSLPYESGDYEGRVISREQRWYHHNGSYFNPKWKFFKRWESYTYDETLHYVESRVERISNQILTPNIEYETYTKLNHKWTSNSILINKYHSGDNIIPRHRDSEVIFGDNPTIAVYSIGAPRIMRFTRVLPNNNKTIKNEAQIDIKLESGSLLIMSGVIQKYYTHEILRDVSIIDDRFSLTFRNHVL
jgi:alkylated DNA repair dioxygenase AlkB